MQHVSIGLTFITIGICTGCPLCMREVNMLKRRDEGVGKIAFVDIDSPDYDAAKNAGISYEQVNSRWICHLLLWVLS